jgi:hypothetical protein
MNMMREVGKLQEDYQNLIDKNKLTKKSLCELCTPFRDKYNLTDIQVLRIVRKEMSLLEMMDLLNFQ